MKKFIYFLVAAVAYVGLFQIYGYGQSNTLAGNLTVQKKFILQGDVTVTQITSNQNNFAPTNLDVASSLRLTSDADRSITGLTGGEDGRRLVVYNDGALFSITLVNGSSSSLAANRFLLAADIVIAARSSVELQYDSTALRWKSVGGAGTGGGGGGSGVTSVDLSAPSIFIVTGNPITTSGTIDLALATQTANKVWAGPATGSAATPTFRSLVAADIPSLSYVPTSRTVNGHALSADVTVTKSDLSLGNVENTALSTWAGSANLATLGTITTGVWNGTAIGDTYISSASTWNAKEVALTFSTGLTRTVNTITVNTSQNIAKLTNLTSNGFVKTSVGDGTLSVDTSTYLTANQTITYTGDVAGSGTTAVTLTIGAGKVTNTMLVGSIAASKLVGSDIATVGTVTTGVWNATAIGDTYISSASTWNAKEVALTFSTGLTRTVNTITVNTSQNIAKLSNLTSNGFIKTGSADGTLSIDTNTYLTTSSASSTYQPLDGTLTALAAYNTNGLLTQTAADTFVGRTVTGTANRISLTNGSGVAGNPTIDIDAAYVGQTSITTLGTVSAGTWSATTIAVDKGGTGLASYAIGDLLQASASTTLAKLASVATGNVLISGGVTTVSSWGKVGLTTHVSGTLAAGNGGTGLASYTIGDLLYASSSSALSARAAVATGQVLISQGTGTAPIWSATPTITSIIAGTSEGFAVAPGTGTSAAYMRFQNTGGASYVGMDSSTASAFSFGNYSFNVYAATDIVLSRAGSERLRATSTGVAVTGPLSSTAVLISAGANPSHAASRATLSYEGSSNSYLQAYGVNSGTQGTLTIRTYSSDGSATANPAVFSSSGVAVTGTLTSTGDATLGNGGTGYHHVRSNGASGGSFTLTKAGTDYGLLYGDNSTTILDSAGSSALLLQVGGVTRIALGSTISISGNTTITGFLGTGSTPTDPSTGTLDGCTLLNGGTAVYSSTTVGLYLRRRSTDGTIQSFYRDTTNVGSISVTTTATAYNTSSDMRLKTNIRALSDSGKIIDALKPVLFDWKSKQSPDTYGFIAQEVYKVFPQAVTAGDKDSPAKITNQWAMDASKFMPVVVSELQSLRTRVSALEKKL